MELLPPSPQKSRNTVSSPDMRHLQNHLSHLSLPNDQGIHTYMYMYEKVELNTGQLG